MPVMAIGCMILAGQQQVIVLFAWEAANDACGVCEVGQECGAGYV